MVTSCKARTNLDRDLSNKEVEVRRKQNEAAHGDRPRAEGATSTPPDTRTPPIRVPALNLLKHRSLRDTLGVHFLNTELQCNSKRNFQRIKTSTSKKQA